MVRKQLEDDWMWKCCAYCGWPIERYLQRTAVYEEYIKPYECRYHGHSGIGLGDVLGVVMVTILGFVLIPVVANSVRSGLIPNANVTSAIPTNATITNTVSTTAGALGPLIQIFPFMVILVGIIYAARMFADKT
jgi:hypothetical protein